MTVRPLFRGEHIDTMLKRLKKGVLNAGLMADIRRCSEYVPKSARRRDKSKAARKRQAREVSR
jgi:ribosomal protein S21